MAADFLTFLTGAGFLRIAGNDRADFIQRQTTNDVAGLAAGAHIATVLTNPAARTLDVLRVFDLDADAYGVLTLPGRGPSTGDFLKRRIFFNDRVTLEDRTAETAVLMLTGARVAESLAQIGLPAVATGRITSVEINGVSGHLAGVDDALGRGFLLITPLEGLEEVHAVLKGAGAAACPPEAVERMRIERGIPGDGELSEDYTPLEAGLDEFISDTKGCYTGQEVIARQITYDKVTRRMAGVRLSGPAEAGAQVRAEDSRIGSLTSVVESPGHGWIGLAVLKRPHNETGTEIRVKNGEGAIAGTVTALPFRGA